MAGKNKEEYTVTMTHPDRGDVSVTVDATDERAAVAAACDKLVKEHPGTTVEQWGHAKFA